MVSTLFYLWVLDFFWFVCLFVCFKFFCIFEYDRPWWVKVRKGLFFVMTDASTTCAEVITLDKLSCITSTDGIVALLLCFFVCFLCFILFVFFAFLIVFCVLFLLFFNLFL